MSLEVLQLSKSYPSFRLQPLSFRLKPGSITGFIGRNGAGKTTTLKSILGFVRPEQGEVLFWGQSFMHHETAIKQRIGFVSGGFASYPKKKLSTISRVTKSFYPTWDDQAYRHYLALFQLDERKTPSELSAGMKVKYALALALSHHAEMLLLDEPTSGLDPVSRDEILDILLDLNEKGITILFSTHIISDLEKCADDILYLRNGNLVTHQSLNSFVDSYRLLSLDLLPKDIESSPFLLGKRRSKQGSTGLIHVENQEVFHGFATPATLESIILHLEKEGW